MAHLRNPNLSLAVAACFAFVGVLQLFAESGPETKVHHLTAALWFAVAGLWVAVWWRQGRRGTR